MLSLDFTLVVELLLFLLFLWGTNRAVLRPLLRTMDARQLRMEQDRADAEAAARRAAELDAVYDRRLAAIHREAAGRVREGRARAAAERRRRMEELHREAEARVAAEAAAMDALTAQGRARFPELVPGLAEEMARRVGPGGRRP